MAGGASANPSSPTGTPVSTQGPTSSVFTPRFSTLPTAPTSTAPGATYSLYNAPRQGFVQPGAAYQPSSSFMPQSVSGYGRFPVAPTSTATRPTADQARAQMMEYQQRYKPGMQQSQQDVQRYAAGLRQAEANRQAEIARRAEEARQAAAAAEAERIRREQEAASSYSDGNYNWGAQGGLASLQGFK